MERNIMEEAELKLNRQDEQEQIIFASNIVVQSMLQVCYTLR